MFVRTSVRAMRKSNYISSAYKEVDLDAKVIFRGVEGKKVTKLVIPNEKELQRMRSKKRRNTKACWMKPGGLK